MHMHAVELMHIYIYTYMYIYIYIRICIKPKHILDHTKVKYISLIYELLHTFPPSMVTTAYLPLCKIDTPLLDSLIEPNATQMLLASLVWEIKYKYYNRCTHIYSKNYNTHT